MAKITFYEIKKSENAKRFKLISDTLGEVLYMPLVGVFKNQTLTAIASGDLSNEMWKSVVEAEDKNVLVYVPETGGRIGLKTIVIEPGVISKLTSYFIEPDIGETSLRNDFLGLLVVVATAAAVDAINPCCFGVFLILLTFVFYGVGNKAVLKVGLAFTTGLFATYLLLGLGLNRVFQHFSEIKYLLSALALVFGSLRILESLGMKVKHVPDAFASRISMRLENVTGPRSGFLAGVVTGSLLLPCSSAPYFIVLSMLSEIATQAAGFALLCLYNLIIIVPFVIITIVVHSMVYSTLELKLWSLENRRWLNLAMGLVLVLLSFINLII